MDLELLLAGEDLLLDRGPRDSRDGGILQQQRGDLLVGAVDLELGLLVLEDEVPHAVELVLDVDSVVNFGVYLSLVHALAVELAVGDAVEEGALEVVVGAGEKFIGDRLEALVALRAQVEGVSLGY